MMTAPRRHAFVVGGTGMLRGVSFELVARGFAVSVVSRNARTLDELRDAAAAAGGVIRPVCVDYREKEAFAFGFGEAFRDLGPPSLAVVWTHPSAPSAPFAVARLLDLAGGRADFFHVRGSASADPSRKDVDWRERFAAFRGIAYHEIVLGFVVGPGRSRWLTEAEISAGVLAAIDAPSPRTVVGVVEPWSARP